MDIPGTQVYLGLGTTWDPGASGSRISPHIPIIRVYPRRGCARVPGIFKTRVDTSRMPYRFFVVANVGRDCLGKVGPSRGSGLQKEASALRTHFQRNGTTRNEPITSSRGPGPGWSPDRSGTTTTGPEGPKVNPKVKPDRSTVWPPTGSDHEMPVGLFCGTENQDNSS